MRCKSFNLAVLTKQGWCLIALVWQAKYFPGDSFLNAQLGSQPSFTLRSVLSVRELLDCFGGLVVVVIKIWMYKWIPRPSTFCVVSPVKLLPSDTNVSILIDSDTKIWNDSLILTRILWITKVQKCNQDYDDFGKLFAVTRFRISLRSLWCLQQLHGQREYCGSWR